MLNREEAAIGLAPQVNYGISYSFKGPADSAIGPILALVSGTPSGGLPW